MAELRIDHSVWEPLTADPDPLQHSIAAELVQDKLGVNNTSLFELVGDDAADEVGGSVVQHAHQAVQGLLEEEEGEEEEKRRRRKKPKEEEEEEE